MDDPDGGGETLAPPATSDRLVMYKTKTICFLGRSTPIVLQNDNGPCPLLAICNVLLLRNAIRISPDAYEVSQDQLLALVADRLLESNSNAKTDDEGYVSNQQQNISDAIDLLPRLATGIDVNVHFRKINDFEFTRECAIFDLLDIGLYHGWIVDPEDRDTAAAIDSKSYNALVSELVALETRSIDSENSLAEEDSVDFVAATAAVLGIPHPSLSRGISFDESPGKTVNENVVRRSGLEEEEDLARALRISCVDVAVPTKTDVTTPTSIDVPVPSSVEVSVPTSTEDLAPISTGGPSPIITVVPSPISTNVVEPISTDVPGPTSPELPPCGTTNSLSSDLNESGYLDSGSQSFVTLPEATSNASVGNSHQANFLSLASEQKVENLSVDTTYAGEVAKSDMTPEIASTSQLDEQISKQPDFSLTSGKIVGAETPYEGNSMQLPTIDGARLASVACVEKNEESTVQANDSACKTSSHNSSDPETTFKFADNPISSDTATFSDHPVSNLDLNSSPEPNKQIVGCEDTPTSVDSAEPIYEGEECIIDSGPTIYGVREPMYEGEAVLAKQTEKSRDDNPVISVEAGGRSQSPHNITSRDGQLIRSFLKINASQLTIYGLFCLQEGLNERELCVFFRNNHFSTMFKFNKELYLLVTDQGYINQPDLVWEKLNEVNGDTVFMTGDFEVFKVEGEVSDKWNQHNAMTSTADYLSTLKDSSVGSTSVNSDLQLAIALQEQEFEQQQQPQQQQQQQQFRPQQVQSSQQPSGGGRSRLVVGPQTQRPTPPTQRKQDWKSSDKCVVM